MISRVGPFPVEATSKTSEMMEIPPASWRPRPSRPHRFINQRRHGLGGEKRGSDCAVQRCAAAMTRIHRSSLLAPEEHRRAKLILSRSQLSIRPVNQSVRCANEKAHRLSIPTAAACMVAVTEPVSRIARAQLVDCAESILPMGDRIRSPSSSGISSTLSSEPPAT